MPSQRKKKVEEEPAGAPEWMVTFSDCMTLLLTFFVLLISFATFDSETLPMLGESFAKALPAIGKASQNKADAMVERQKTIKHHKEGSDTPTLMDPAGTNFMKDKKPLDFQNLKVFTIRSSDFFWGNGTALTQEAKDVLDALAQFLNQQAGRIVISENGPDRNRTLGFNRGMAVMNYLNRHHKVKKKRFNLSTSTTLRNTPEQRQLEITLLDRSVYE